MRLFYYTLLSLTLLTFHPALAQAIFPPNGARIHTTNPQVKLQWEGDKNASYYLQVYASGREMYTGTVKGTSTTIPLPLGPLYQWKVSRVASGGYLSVGSYSFQLLAKMTFHFDGRDGATGQAGRDGLERGFSSTSSDRVAGQDGGPGQPGENGRDVNVRLRSLGDYIEVEIQGPNRTDTFLLDSKSAPILISSIGGHGGPGGRGGDGASGYYELNTSPTTPYFYNAGAGGNGGPGGAGGNGGNVIVTASGVEANRYLQIRNEGGLGGFGGGPGRPGPTTSIATLPNGINSIQDYLPTVASPGHPGAPGRDGREGNVQL